MEICFVKGLIIANNLMNIIIEIVDNNENFIVMEINGKKEENI